MVKTIIAARAYLAEYEREREELGYSISNIRYDSSITLYVLSKICTDDLFNISVNHRISQKTVKHKFQVCLCSDTVYPLSHKKCLIHLGLDHLQWFSSFFLSKWYKLKMRLWFAPMVPLIFSLNSYYIH